MFVFVLDIIVLSAKIYLDTVINVTGPIGEEISAATFRTVLEFCYTRKIVLNDDNIYDIFCPQLVNSLSLHDQM